MSRPPSSLRCRPWRPAHRVGTLAALVLTVTGAATWGVGAGSPVARAEVVHGVGFEATVLGWTSWYGSYRLGELGAGWCIDHGLLAPDAAFGYVPTDVPDAPADTKAAVSWLLTRNDGSDPVSSAAMMLATHDLMGATYPYGRIDVDALTPANLGGFGGHEADVIATARRFKADGLAHAHRRAPFRLTLDAPRTDPGGNGRLTATLVDDAGAPVANAPVAFAGRGASVAGTPTSTGDDGRAFAAFVAGAGDNELEATVTIADPTLRAFAPTRARAQRIGQPHPLVAHAAASFGPAPSPSSTTTTTTEAPPTSGPPTSRPPTAPPTTTAPRSTTAPPTTSPLGPPSTTGPSTTAPPTTSPTALPPSIPAGPPPTPPTTTGRSLPVTGAAPRGLSLIGVGLLLLGGAARHVRRSLVGPERVRRAIR